MRVYRITFIGGLAIGYVLGAQAGRERYEQLKRLARKATENPAVQQTAGALQAQATATARSAREQAAAAARSAKQQASAKVRSAREQATARVRSSKETAPSGMHKTRIGRRRSESDRTKARTANVSGDGAMPRQGGDDHSPFVPVDGSFGDHDVMS